MINKKPTKEELEAQAQQFISDSDFNELLRKNFKVIEDELNLHPTDGYPPHLMIHGEKDKDGKRLTTLVLVADGFQDNKKQELVFGMGHKFATDGNHHAVCVFMATEAWMAGETKDEKLKDLPPSQRPDKQEGLVMAGLTIDGRANMATAMIKRIKGNKMMLYSEKFMDYKNGEINTDPVLLKQFMAGYIIGMVLGKKNPVPKKETKPN